MHCKPEKTVIITGANSGIGYNTAYYLAIEKKWHIIFACRDRERGLKALHRLKKQTRWQSMELMILDLASFSSIRGFVKDVSVADIPPLYALVNNAGVQIVTGTTYTEDGYESTFGVNHLGPFLLTNLLLGMITPPGRIVMVSSEAHNPATSVGLPDPEYTDPVSLAKPLPDKKINRNASARTGKVRYATSKLCNLFFTYELDRKLAVVGYHEPGNMIAVHAYAPGIVPGTGIGKDYHPIARFGWRYLLPFFTFLPGLYSIKQAGKNCVRLIIDPDLETRSGLYFEGRRAKKSSVESYDRTKAAELWETSIQLTGLADSFFDPGKN